MVCEPSGGEKATLYAGIAPFRARMMIGKDTGQDASRSKSEPSLRGREVDFALSIVLHTSMDKGNWAERSGAAR